MLSNEAAFNQIKQALEIIQENDKKNIMEIETRFDILEYKNSLIKKALQDIVEKL